MRIVSGHPDDLDAIKLVARACKSLAAGEMFHVGSGDFPKLLSPEFQIQVQDAIKDSGLTHRVTFRYLDKRRICFLTAYPLPLFSASEEVFEARTVTVYRRENRLRTGVILKYVLTAFLVGVLCGLAISFPIHSKGVQHVENLRKR